MNNQIIQVKNISKKYVISHQPNYQTLRDTVIDFIKKPFTLKTNKEDFWALKDINFEINRGDAIGLIGPNGSGKSTLLKILSQISVPTTGEITIRGRVASLLEIGTGFHPELTGRENVFLNGAILGMSRKEIAEKFDDIVKFSEVGKFIDTPVKRYSSGMHVRLAFSVAAHMDPDILIIDEVLAVGDADFQKKALGKMDSVTKEAGRTIIFVSHNMEAIKKVCKKCILLSEGKIVMYDENDKVIRHYLNMHSQSSTTSLLNRKDRSGDGEVRFTAIKITNTKNEQEIKSGDKLRITLKYKSKSLENLTNVRVVITIMNEDMKPVIRLDSDVSARSFPDELNAEGEIICETEEAHLIEGRYFTDIDFLIKGSSRDNVLMAGQFSVSTNLQDYGYKILADKTITSNLIKFSFRQ